MLIRDVSIWLVFVEGLASFLSPCILPLLPVYLSYLAGASIEEIEKSHHLRRTMTLNAVGFVLGISFVFLLIGAGASTIGSFFIHYEGQLRMIGGVIVIVFGLHHAGIFNIPFLNAEKKMQFKQGPPSFFNAFILGITFSFGWTPCIGPMLGAVIVMAGTAQSIYKAMGLLGVYALGMSIPFMIAAVAMSTFIQRFKVIYKYFDVIKKVSGILLILMGILLMINHIDIIGGMWG